MDDGLKPAENCRAVRSPSAEADHEYVGEGAIGERERSLCMSFFSFMLEMCASKSLRGPNTPIISKNLKFSTLFIAMEMI